MSDTLFKKLSSIAKSTTDLKPQETHCVDFYRSCISTTSNHFKMIDLRYYYGGLVVKYKCSLDEKIYSVTIKPESN